MKHIVIIGNGIAGITTARHIRKMSDHRITVISAESEHFYSRTALMYIYMGQMTYQHTKPYEDWFWAKNRIELMRAYVQRIDTTAHTLHMHDGASLAYDTLIIATGSKPNKFGWKGQDLPGVQGLYSLQDLEALEQNTKGIAGEPGAVIVGGGLVGVELAEMLLSRNIPVTFLIRENNYWDNVLPTPEAQLVERHIRQHGATVHAATHLKEVLPDESGRACAVLTDTGLCIPCRLVGLTAGVSPNIEVVKNSAVQTNRGVVVNRFLETNVPDVYAAGDCAEIVDEQSPVNGKVEQLWYTGRMQGEALARTVCGQRTAYDRGIWFNSAKFFDIEYQTYGYVSNVPLPGQKSLYWEHTDGRKCVRIVYTADATRAVTGFNVLGIRYRQAVCSQWIAEGRSVEYVLQNLGQANFDPEFFKQYEADIVALYNTQHPDAPPLTLKRKRGLFW